MNEILKSKFFQNLKEGKLPEVNVGISDRGLVSLFVGLLAVGIALIVASKIAKSI